MNAASITMNPIACHHGPLQPQERITQLDVARGIAVVLMIMGHSIDAVLAPEARMTEAFRFYEILRGLTAPLFLLLAGFAFSVATVKRWDEHTRFGRQTGRRFLRAALLLAIGYALHLPFFSFGKLLLTATAADHARFLQADILHCVALSLAALQLTVLVARTPARHLQLTLLLGVAITVSAPLVWSADLSGVFPRAVIPYLNQQHLSMFPLVPYAAYMFFGAALGHSYLLAREGGSDRAWIRRTLIGTCLLVTAGLAGGFLPWAVYPEHDFWNSNPGILAIRAGIVMTPVLALLRARRFPALFARATTALGQSSLMIYVVHLIVVYGSVVNPGLGSLLGRDLSVAAAITVGAGVLVAMITLALGVRYLRSDYRLHLRIAQAGAATLLMYLFITRPY